MSRKYARMRAKTWLFCSNLASCLLGLVSNFFKHFKGLLTGTSSTTTTSVLHLTCERLLLFVDTRQHLIIIPIDTNTGTIWQHRAAYGLLLSRLMFVLILILFCLPYFHICYTKNVNIAIHSRRALIHMMIEVRTCAFLAVSCLYLVVELVDVWCGNAFWL